MLLISNGNVIDGFTGADQNAVNKFFEGLKLLTSGNKEKEKLQAGLFNFLKSLHKIF